MCLIETGFYNEGEDENGKFYHRYPFYIRPIYCITKWVQKGLWMIGIALYDPIFGECTPDFNCCQDIGRKTFIRLHRNDNERC